MKSVRGGGGGETIFEAVADYVSSEMLEILAPYRCS
jgi:hypothetical protein